MFSKSICKANDNSSITNLRLQACLAVLLILGMLPGTTLADIEPPKLTTSKPFYQVDEPIEVNFSGAEGNATDWICLFRDITCLAWRYTDGTYSGTAGITNGTVTFSGGLSSPDYYEARLFFNNSYNVEATDQFSVTGDSFD